MRPTYELCHRAEGPGVTCGVAVQEGRAHLDKKIKTKHKWVFQFHTSWSTYEKCEILYIRNSGGSHARLTSPLLRLCFCLLWRLSCVFCAHARKRTQAVGVASCRLSKEVNWLCTSEEWILSCISLYSLKHSKDNLCIFPPMFCFSWVICDTTCGWLSSHTHFHFSWSH